MTGMKILHVIPYMHPRAGGPPVVVENLVRESDRLGHHSRIITTRAYCGNDADDLVRRLNELVPTIFLRRAEILPAFSRIAHSKIGVQVHDADIVHLHTLWNPLNISVRRACHQLHRPYVLMPHGMLDPYSLSIRRLKKSVYMRMFERRNIAAAKRMIYTTPEEERLASLSALRLPKGELVPLGANASCVQKEALRAEFLARFPHANGRRTLLFLGRLHPKKGLDRILNCLRSLQQSIPNVLLVVAGDGDAGYTQRLRELVSALALDNHVLFAGRLDGELKWASFAAAELFLLPSRQENFAITVAEAMQMGVPVIITENVNTWPYVKEAGAGLVLDERDINALLPQAIEALLKDDATRLRMGVQGSRYARERLTWHASAQKLLACYDQVLSGVNTNGNCNGS
jgi:glycosyltransferase involved in cell wall biosynthesis